MYGIILTLILVVMGGAIAFIGDKLGTKVGKKKLSIFGLRPRHTSIIVTIITGILITSLTLGILTLTSQNVRVALFGMERLNQQIRDSQKSLSEITVQLAKADAEREETVKALEKAQADYTTALSDLTQSKDQIVALEATKQQLETTKANLDRRVGELSSEQAKLEGDVRQLGELTQRLSEGIQFVREGDIFYRAGELIHSDVLPYNKDPEKAAPALAGVLESANRIILARLGIKDNVEAIWVMQSEFEEAAETIRQSHQEMIVRVAAAGNIVYGEPVRAHIALYPNKRIYNEDELIYSEMFEVKHEIESEAEQIILGFLKQVNLTATKKGIIPDPLAGSVGVMDGAQFYDIVNSIEPLSGKIKITAYAKENTSASGPLRLKIKIEQVYGNTR